MERVVGSDPIRSTEERSREGPLLVLYGASVAHRCCPRRSTSTPRSVHATSRAAGLATLVATAWPASWAAAIRPAVALHVAD